MRKEKALYSEFATARESTTASHVLAESERQVEEWRVF